MQEGREVKVRDPLRPIEKESEVRSENDGEEEETYRARSEFRSYHRPPGSPAAGPEKRRRTVNQCCCLLQMKAFSVLGSP